MIPGSRLPQKVQQFIWNSEVMREVARNDHERALWLNANPSVVYEMLIVEQKIEALIQEQRLYVINGIRHMKYKDYSQNSKVEFTKRKRLDF